jgi:pimeloyl-ACP methyl ester carboxylesterase
MLPPDITVRRHAIVLVHGAWVGDWSWAPVLPLLAASGRTVHNVALTGYGSRSHLLSPDITLADHVADVVDLVETFDLVDITLVGHSYGGRVITDAYAPLADRIARLVYLDAHAPIAPDTGQTPERVRAAEEAGGYLPFTEYDPDPAYVGGEAGVAWFLERTRPQAFRTILSPMTGTLPESLPKAYLFCSGYRPSRFTAYAAAAEAAPDWEYHELDADHWVMFSHPRQVADIILQPSG